MPEDCQTREERCGGVTPRAIALGLGAVTMTIHVGAYIFDLGPDREYSIGWTLYMILNGINAWLWIVAILGFGRRYLNFSNNMLKYAGEAALPFYIFHQTVIVVIGYYVVKWDMGIPGKFLIINVASFVAIVVLYDLLVKRINLMRFFFGMKPKKKQLQTWRRE